MNFDNLSKAIAVMERAKEHSSVNMGYWQTMRYDTDEFVQTEDELHECGNSACFAGHLALSPEWSQDPLNTLDSQVGYPIRMRFSEKLIGVDAIADWLGLPISLTNCLVNNVHDEHGIHCLYKVQWKEVRAEHVLKELRLLEVVGHSEYMRLLKLQ